MALRTYLGDLEEGLGDINDTRHLLDIADAGLDGLGVVLPRLVEDALDLLVLGISPLRVGRATELDERSPRREEAEGDDGLLVHDVVLAADGIGGKTGGAGQDGGLGDETVAGERVDDGLGLLLGVLRGDIGRVAGGRDRAQRGEGPAGHGRPEEVVGACSTRWACVSEPARAN